MLVAGTIISTLAYLYLQFGRNQETISNLFYVNFSLPLLFCLAGALFHTVIVRSSCIAYIIALVITLAGSWYVFCFSSYHILHQLNIESLLQSAVESPQRDLIIVCSVLVVSLLMTLWRRYAVVSLTIFVVALNLVSASEKFPTAFDMDSRFENFRTVTNWVKLVDEIDPGRNAHIVYDLVTPDGGAYIEMASASHLWHDRGVLSESFPRLDRSQSDAIRSTIAHAGAAKFLYFSDQPDAPSVFKGKIVELGGNATLDMTYRLPWIADRTVSIYLFTVREQP